MLFGALITLIIGAILVSVWINLYSTKHIHFTATVYLYFVAAIIESLRESILVEAYLTFNYDISAKSEAIAFFLKTSM
jgi:hypothetical protein